jgi:hypothetical protein
LHSNFVCFAKKRIKNFSIRVFLLVWKKEIKIDYFFYISKLSNNALIKLKLVSPSGARAHTRKRNFSCERYLDIRKKSGRNFLAFNLFPLFLLIKSRQISFNSLFKHVEIKENNLLMVEIKIKSFYLILWLCFFALGHYEISFIWWGDFYVKI